MIQKELLNQPKDLKQELVQKIAVEKIAIFTTCARGVEFFAFNTLLINGLK